LLTRNNEVIVPQGPTTLQEGDTLTVLANPEAIAEIRTLFS
jgi:Trk K+ transport system NAD-binding subunit